MPLANSGAAPTPVPALAADLVPAFRQIEAESYGPARLRLRRSLAERPSDPQIEFLLGLSYHRENQYARAVGHFERAVGFEPPYPPAWYFLGWARFYLGQLDEAESSFRRHLEMQPDEADSHFALGLIDLERDLLTEAEQRFLHSIELLERDEGAARDIAKARVRLADILMIRGDEAGARGELIRAIALHHESYEAHYKLSRVLTRLGDEEGAARAHAESLLLRERIYPQTRFPE